MQKISNEKGITMVTLVITIFILGLISIPTTFSIVNIIKAGDLARFKEDLTALSEAVSQAYSLEDDISDIGPVYSGNITNIPKNPNDNNTYYVIDVSKLDRRLQEKTRTRMRDLAYGESNYGIRAGDVISDTDVYIINQQSRMIYYVEGFVNQDNETLYSYPGNYTNIVIQNYTNSL